FTQRCTDGLATTATASIGAPSCHAAAASTAPVRGPTSAANRPGPNPPEASVVRRNSAATTIAVAATTPPIALARGGSSGRDRVRGRGRVTPAKPPTRRKL